MPKTLHYTMTMAIKVVISDDEAAQLEEAFTAIDAGTTKRHIADQQKTGMGLPLEARIDRLTRAVIREGSREFLIEEFPPSFSFSPAKVTQVIVPRIKKAAEEDCLCGLSKDHSDECR